jgi:hypothetical protein
MKYFISAVLLFTLSCNEEKPAPVTTTVNQTKTDTIARKKDANPYADVDLSPLDISYFPVDYPVGKMSGSIKEQPIARIIYSRPHKQGREIFGKLLKYGERWRLGANEATELELFRNVTIQNKNIGRGRYVLYCIPRENEWDIVFNSNIYSWGLRQDSTADLHKFTIPVTDNQPSIEYFTMVFEGTNEGADLIIAWDDVVARLPIHFKK